jgi:hypothetical protein
MVDRSHRLPPSARKTADVGIEFITSRVDHNWRLDCCGAVINLSSGPLALYDVNAAAWQERSRDEVC